MKESFEVEVKSNEELHVYKFVALLQAAMEYFVYSEEALTENIKIVLSTKYKERFAFPNRKKSRAVEKLYEEEMRAFKTQFKEFKKKNMNMLQQLDNIRVSDQEGFDLAMDKIFEHTNKLIIKKHD